MFEIYKKKFIREEVQIEKEFEVIWIDTLEFVF